MGTVGLFMACGRIPMVSGHAMGIDALTMVHQGRVTVVTRDTTDPVTMGAGTIEDGTIEDVMMAGAQHPQGEIVAMMGAARAGREVIVQETVAPERKAREVLVQEGNVQEDKGQEVRRPEAKVQGDSAQEASSLGRNRPVVNNLGASRQEVGHRSNRAHRTGDVAQRRFARLEAAAAEPPILRPRRRNSRA